MYTNVVKKIDRNDTKASPTKVEGKALAISNLSH